MSNSINELATGGRGITLMWQIADELSYTRTLDGRNCLLVSKNYGAEGLDRPRKIKQASALDGLMNRLKRWDWQDEEQQEEELNDSPSQKISLLVNTDVSGLTKVLGWFEQLKDLSLPQEAWWACQLALAEGFTNAVRHAHKNLPVETPIQLEVTVFARRLELRIWDCGQAFDLNAKLTENLAADRKRNLNLDSWNEHCLSFSFSKTLDESQLLIAG
jgi:serine/threonine-protein kinase RsbW